jgi:hypothetical protein
MNIKTPTGYYRMKASNTLADYPPETQAIERLLAEIERRSFRDSGGSPRDREIVAGAWNAYATFVGLPTVGKTMRRRFAQ